MKVKIDTEVFHDTRMTQQRVNDLVRDIGRAVEEGVNNLEYTWLKDDIDKIIKRLNHIKGQLQC